MNIALPRGLGTILYHGASPGRWSRRGENVEEPTFSGGCFMTPNPRLACLYAADWQSREDKHDFIQSVIDEVFALGDSEELLALGFIKGNEDDGFSRTKVANAKYVLKNWSKFNISHDLVAPSAQTHHHYPHGALVFPLNLRTADVRFFDCIGGHFDDLDGTVFGMDKPKVLTDEVVEFFRGKTAAIWFMNLTDPAHATRSVVSDTVFVYDPQHISFQLTKKIVAEVS